MAPWNGPNYQQQRTWTEFKPPQRRLCRMLKAFVSASGTNNFAKLSIDNFFCSLVYEQDKRAQKAPKGRKKNNTVEKNT